MPNAFIAKLTGHANLSDQDIALLADACGTPPRSARDSI